MAKVNFTTALKRFYPDLAPQSVEASTVADLLNELETRYPGLKDYLVDELGRLRKHVNIYIGDTMVSDRETLCDQVGQHDEVLIFQALSGG